MNFKGNRSKNKKFLLINKRFILFSASHFVVNYLRIN